MAPSILAAVADGVIELALTELAGCRLTPIEGVQASPFFPPSWSKYDYQFRGTLSSASAAISGSSSPATQTTLFFCLRIQPAFQVPSR